MGFCEHCEGQRFDRAQVLRVLRATRKGLRDEGMSVSAERAVLLAINAVRSLAIPHIEVLDDDIESHVVH